MSLWHSPQSSESMKKSEGIKPPVLVFAEDGQNGDFGPAPSSVIESGGDAGLWMRACGSVARAAAAAIAKVAMAVRQRGSSIARPTIENPMCAQRAQR